MYIVTLHVPASNPIWGSRRDHLTTARYKTATGAFRRAAEIAAWNITGATVTVVEVEA